MKSLRHVVGTSKWSDIGTRRRFEHVSVSFDDRYHWITDESSHTTSQEGKLHVSIDFMWSNMIIRLLFSHKMRYVFVYLIQIWNYVRDDVQKKGSNLRSFPFPHSLSSRKSITPLLITVLTITTRSTGRLQFVEARMKSSFLVCIIETTRVRHRMELRSIRIYWGCCFVTFDI